MRSTRVPAVRLAVHLSSEPLEHVEGVLLERAEETLRLDRWSTGVVRTEGTLRGRRFDLQALASSSDVMSASGSRWCVVGTSDLTWESATAALGAHVLRQGRVTHCIGARAQLSNRSTQNFLFVTETLLRFKRSLQQLIKSFQKLLAHLIRAGQLGRAKNRGKKA